MDKLLLRQSMMKHLSTMNLCALRIKPAGMSHCADSWTSSQCFRGSMLPHVRTIY